jgi:hypothetical protein
MSPRASRREYCQAHNHIATLYAREINCGCETFWDGSIRLWIGDRVNGHKAETMFSRHRMSEAPQWLIDEAARLYPGAFQ